MVRHGGTWVLDLSSEPGSLSLGFFGFFFRGLILADRSPPFLASGGALALEPPRAIRSTPEWLSFTPLLAAALITLIKGDESPGSGRLGVIGALVFFPSEAVQDKLHSPWPTQ